MGRSKKRHGSLCNLGAFTPNTFRVKYCTAARTRTPGRGYLLSAQEFSLVSKVADPALHLAKVVSGSGLNIQLQNSSKNDIFFEYV